MGILPYIEAPEQQIEMTSQFGGYNHKISIADNEFYDMKNMSAKDFPLASVREKRGMISVGDKGITDTAQGIVVKDKLILPTVDRGEIGVTIAEDVAAVPSVTIERATKIDGKWYTEIEGNPETYSARAYINDAYLKGNTQRTLRDCEFRLDSGDGDKWLWARRDDSKEVTIFANRNAAILFLPFPHGEVELGRAWMPIVFCTDELFNASKVDVEKGQITIRCYAYETGNATLLERLKTEGTTLYFGPGEKTGLYNWQAKIVSYSETYTYASLPKRDITFQMVGDRWNIESWVSSNGVFRYIASGLDSASDRAIPARKIGDYVYSKVKVNAKYASDVRALMGQTIYLSNQYLEVANVQTADDGYFLYVVRPHSEIKAGSTAEGNRLYLTELDPETGESTTSNVCAAQDGKRMLIEKGGELIIFPEKVIINTLEKTESGQFADVQQMEMTNILKGDYSYRLCDINGNIYDRGHIGNTAPSNPYNGAAWIDTSKTPPVLKVWSTQTNQWAVTQAYCQIESAVLSDEWSVGDAVSIEFGEGAENILSPLKDQKYFVLSEVGEKGDKRFVRFPTAMTSYLEKKADNETQSITIKRTIPDMDFVTECKNRLWGCKFGMVDGKMINEIFASKLGDAKNWNHFTNTSIDSYYVSTGNDGEFTGIGTYKNNPVFFREDCFHLIYGDYPAAYGLQTIHCHGLEKGSDKGVTVMNDVMFYKSPVGVMAYTGTTPVNISEKFGSDKYKNAISCSLGNKMYYSLENKNGRTLFVFDDGNKIWYKEDDLDVKDFAVYDGEVYALLNDGSLISMHGVNGKLEDKVEWSLESGNIGYSTPFRKRISKINLRMMMELDATASVCIQYDSDGNWHHVSNIRPYGKVKSMAIPIVPHRCDHFALKIEGKGDCKILSLTKYMEDGSDAD